MNFDLASTPLPQGVTVLEASAGTGKTYALAGVYLRLIVEHALQPAEILVTTYTEAATAELRGRIRERLECALAVFREGQPDTTDTLLPALLARCDRVEATARLSAALNNFDEAAIHTIHGFCERMLRERAFESGTAFDTELLPDQNALLGEVAADFWRREAYGSDPIPAALLLASGLDVDQLAKLIPRAVSNPQMQILPEPDKLHPLHTSARALLQNFRESWHGWRAEVRALFLTQTGNKWAKSEAKLGKVDLNVDALDVLANSIEAQSSCYAALATFTNEWMRENTTKVGKPATPTHSFFDLATEFSALLAAHGPAARAKFLHWARDELARRKAELGVRSFDDLLTTLHHALHTERGEALTAAIRTRFKAALVDEFQDTDTVQDAIFSRLFGAGDAWLFLIGDPKQAIYGFRGADVFTYLDATTRTPEGHRYDLGTNHRSTSRLVNAVNELFSTHPQPFLENGIAFHKVAAAGRADKIPLLVQGKQREPMRLWHWKEDEPISKGLANRVLPGIVASEIRRMLETATLDGAPLTPGDCAVLTYSNKQARMMQAALAARNIPSVLMSNANVFGSRESRQLRILLAALAEPWREDKVRAALLTDFFVSATPDSLGEVIREAHARWRERGFIVMLREFIRTAHVRETLLARRGGERALTNLLQLAELIHDAASRQRLGAAAVVRWLSLQSGDDNKEHELRLERDDEAVHVVTIHKSKGLEYAVVFVPFAWENAELRKGEPAIYHEKKDGTTSLVLDLNAHNDSPQMQQMLTERLAEQMRLLYVALTRAKHECHVVVGEFNKCEYSAMRTLLNAAGKSTLDVSRFAKAKPDCFAVLPPPDADGAQWQPPQSETSAPHARTFHANIEKNWRILSFSGLTEGSENEGADRDAGTSIKPDVPLAGVHALPRGKRFGNCLHAIFEHLDFTDLTTLDTLVEHSLTSHGMDTAYRSALSACVAHTLDAELLPGLHLRNVPPGATLRELEFHLPAGRLTAEKLSDFTSAGLRFEPRQGILKGYMDIIFENEGVFHIADWKSNWLGADETAYTQEAMKTEMVRHRYDLQWQLYAVALRRWLRHRLGPGGEKRLGTVFYIFARGVHPSQQELGILRITPQSARLDALDAVLGGAA